MKTNQKDWSVNSANIFKFVYSYHQDNSNGNSKIVINTFNWNKAFEKRL